MKHSTLSSSPNSGNTLVSRSQFKPMLFSTEMVQAIINGTKTQTRRIITDVNSRCTADVGELDFNDYIEDSLFEPYYLKVARPIDQTRHRLFPRNQISTIIWVRETFQKVELSDDCDYEGYIYKANKNSIEWEMSNDEWKWKPSLFMPKEACRLFLEVTDIKAERLQDISKEDAIAEGIGRWVEERMKSKPTHYQLYYTEPGDDSMYSSCPILSYESLWKKINGVKSWEENPMVWVKTFKIVECPKGFC